ncbi:hypothetical protein BU25DRAFT_413701 [Macroventuria anomochaeta]|uniref:Uncharacterized protein n=1 Tax=Macroventuria anomochaeta TaxID=301207 RepID=A0ACB6RT91_9PLEO|nr:uncharacterized protein BU25DRAFT_413701 [Macroventuria anomochaeta]KAF2624127.1 hypothetical protein BU25DRAFT_413701 [Macroventuria anomochaeta]
MGLAPAQGEGTPWRASAGRSCIKQRAAHLSIFVLVAEVLPDLPPINARVLRTTAHDSRSTNHHQCIAVRPSARPGAQALALQESSVAINYCRVHQLLQLASVTAWRLCSTSIAIRAPIADCLCVVVAPMPEGAQLHGAFTASLNAPRCTTNPSSPSRCPRIRV